IDRQTPAGASDELPRHIAVHSAMTFLYFLLFAALFIFGMQEVLQHYILRRMLSKKGMLPFRLVAFLDYAASELNFLQKVGGGYIFLHRYLLEYFAEIEDDTLEPQP
ncbi:MAG: hypothetical protein R2834_17990, partial [Rhodothermales bacterium]